MNMNHAFCPLCGAVITVDLSQDAMICPACGRPFLNVQAVAADPAPAAPTTTFSKKEFSTTPLSDLDIQYGVLLRYKGKNSYVILPSKRSAAMHSSPPVIFALPFCRTALPKSAHRRSQSAGSLLNCASRPRSR